MPINPGGGIKKYQAPRVLLIILSLLGLASCECPGDGPTKPKSKSSLAATNIIIEGGVESLSVVTNSRDTLTAEVFPSNHTDGEVEWSSDNTNAVTVSKAGPNTASFLAVAVGSATITAWVGDETDTIIINVSEEPILITNIVIEGGPFTITNNTPATNGILTATLSP